MVSDIRPPRAVMAAIISHVRHHGRLLIRAIDSGVVESVVAVLVLISCPKELVPTVCFGPRSCGYDRTGRAAPAGVRVTPDVRPASTTEQVRHALSRARKRERTRVPLIGVLLRRVVAKTSIPIEVRLYVETDFDTCQTLRMSMSLALLVPRRDAALGHCTPLAREPISPAQAENIAPMLKALADPVRLRLMSMILSYEGGEACAMCDLTEGFDLSQSTLSHHLKVLYDAGLVDRDKRGVWVYYRARPEVMEVLRTLFDGADDESVTASRT